MYHAEEGTKESMRLNNHVLIQQKMSVARCETIALKFFTFPSWSGIYMRLVSRVSRSFNHCPPVTMPEAA